MGRGEVENRNEVDTNTLIAYEWNVMPESQEKSATKLDIYQSAHSSPKQSCNLNISRLN